MLRATLQSAPTAAAAGSASAIRPAPTHRGRQVRRRARHGLYLFILVSLLLNGVALTAVFRPNRA
jgi:hypothetical protein